MTSRHRSEVRVAIDGPAHDESLSSLLDRSASFWGVDRSAMAAALEFGLDDGDADAPSQAALHTLSLATGFSATRLDTHRIASDVSWLFPEQRIGYCPCCWAEDAAQGRAPYFRRAWAACAAVACDRHGCLLYAWDVDAQGCRRPPPPGRSARLNAQWRADLTHAEQALDRRGLETLTGFASRAHVAIERGDAWPSNWRGDAAAGRALTELLTTNPAPFPERLVMDRLVPDSGDARWFSGNRRATRSRVESEPSPMQRLGDPAMRRTAWWLMARTLVIGWAPLPVRGTYGICTNIESWWRRRVGSVVSGHARRTYADVGRALGLADQTTGDLFAI